MATINTHDVKYSAKYDARFNILTKCKDPNCWFCPNRPENAIQDMEEWLSPV